MKKIFRVNNFDIIRLLAAMQVVVSHSMAHLEVESSLGAISRMFPGVPIFFFISGFLISKSYENNPVLVEYAQNRILRLYPALIVCTFIAVSSVYFSGYLSKIDVSAHEILFWILGQISIVQFYNPDFMREFGTGVLNGSLPTITVELQFYIVLPILYWIFGLAKPNKSNASIVALILFFMMFHIAHFNFLGEYENNLLFKLWSVSFIPWIYMFLIGVLFQKNFITFYHFLSGKVLYVLPIYLIFSYFSVNYFGLRTGSGINPIQFFLLAVLIFSFAYSYSTLSTNILKGNDISYGVYIYHMPVVNLLIYYGYISNIFYVFVTIAVTVLLAIMSWLLVEKPSMKLKKHPLNPLNKSST